jgi:hypothetical protein
MSRSVEERLQPYERAIQWAQEVLLFHRPLVLGIIIVGLLVFAHFVSASESGVVATLVLIVCVYYAALVVYSFFGARLAPYLSAELPPIPPDQSNRVRSVSEISSLIGSISGLFAKIPAIPLKGILQPIFLLLLAVVLHDAELLVFNLVVVLVLLLLPGVLLLPPVHAVWSPLFEKAAKPKRD